ncbi:hypothetical protein KFE98_13350 [bacterium SCSIO 12741]|nr:hypothetical protein KFE98_13350 [bacterium SCSIO 12741]
MILSFISRHDFLELAFYGLFVFLLWLIVKNALLAFDNVGYDGIEKRKRILRFLGVLAMWLIYIGLLSASGFLNNLELPPRFPLLIILPLFIASGVFLWKYKRHPALHALPIHHAVGYQSFRIFIEVVFYGMFLEGVLPIVVTFEGYNMDILIGISAPIVALLVHKKWISRPLLILWNIAGIAVVLNAAFTFVTSFYFPSVWGEEQSMISSEFATFPYLLLPGFFMPSAIFVHLFSLVQLTSSPRN